MAQCRNCGKDSPRVVTVLRDGKAVDSCPACHPEDFPAEPFLMPSDRKLYYGWDAEPAHYKMKENPEGGYIAQASDSLIKDTVDLINKSDEAVAEENKRRTRRTEPLTPDEIKQSLQYGLNVIRPRLERERLNRQYRHT